MMFFLPPTIPTVQKAGGDIRLNLTTSCQKGCNFCHLEGHKSREEIGQLNPALAAWKSKKGLPLIDRLGNALGEEDVEATIKIAHLLSLNSVHLTGGEPTLHPHILAIIGKLKDAGLTVGMTTHAEMNEARFEALLQSGLHSMNISLHAVTAEQYVAMDLLAQQIAQSHSYEAALRYAATHLTNKRRNIERAIAFARSSHGTFQVKANSVVQDTSTAIEIVRWCNQIGCSIRLQRDINQKKYSDLLLQHIIEQLQAEPTLLEQAIGDSSASGVHYSYPGGSFKIKLFGNVYINSMCTSCLLKDTDGCRERFYGIRIEHGQVITCIDLQDAGMTRFGIGDFIRSLHERRGVPFDIQQVYQRMHTAEKEVIHQ